MIRSIAKTLVRSQPKFVNTRPLLGSRLGAIFNLLQLHIVQPTHMQVILVHLIIFAAGLLYSQSSSLDRAEAKMSKWLFLGLAILS